MGKQVRSQDFSPSFLRTKVLTTNFSLLASWIVIDKGDQIPDFFEKSGILQLCKIALIDH